MGKETTEELTGEQMIEGLPRDYVSCPGCGQLYGHHNTKVCMTCEECGDCCQCEHKDLLTRYEAIMHMHFGS